MSYSTPPLNVEGRHGAMEEEPSSQYADHRQRIAEQMLLSSPPGQFGHVLTDLRKLLPASVLTESFVQEVTKVYNARRGIGLGKVEEMRNLTEGQERLNTKRQELERALAGHVTESYASDSVSKKQKHRTCARERVNLANFWSASWLSEWSIDEDKLSGSIQVRAHNFEDGNVQLHVNKFYPVLSVSLRSDTAIIVECIKLAEETLSRNIEATCQELSTEGLHSLRRKLPVSKVKMNWSDAAAQNISKVLDNNTEH